METIQPKKVHSMPKRISNYNGKQCTNVFTYQHSRITNHLRLG